MNLTLHEAQAARLLELAEMVVGWGRSTNLTGHRTVFAAMRHLIVDALALMVAIDSQTEAGRDGVLVDLGSGAGFPGAPIAIARPQLSVVLVDSRERRNHFQRAVRRQLEVSNLESRLGRIEELQPTRAGLVIAQAVAPPEKVLAWGMAWLEPEGFLVIPGGPEAPSPGPHPLIAESGEHAYAAPGNPLGRTLWWGRRRSD
ncbi:MAG: 16S rRNA (guanine(527)-N(7))-methyltransferase RsmG [Myxococcota bacterium]|nr:16S rRNA (guanine(527)-N(7))-methyltransferase RsmG [Myxococcota bacterium]